MTSLLQEAPAGLQWNRGETERVEGNGPDRAMTIAFSLTRASEGFRESVNLLGTSNKEFIFYGFVGTRGVGEKRTRRLPLCGIR